MPKEEYRPPPSKKPEKHKPQQQGANGAPGLQSTGESRAYPTLPQKSVLNRAVERTHNLYERNGWFFLPFSEIGEVSPTLPSRPSTTIFYAPGLDYLIEEPKKGDNTQSPQEARMDSAKVPHPYNETNRQPLDPIARAMREAARREGIDPQALIQELTLKLQQMLADHDPREADELQRMFDIPPDPSSPSPDDLQRMFDMSSDEPPSDDKR
jgi:hypothetical protein